MGIYIYFYVAAPEKTELTPSSWLFWSDINMAVLPVIRRRKRFYFSKTRVVWSPNNSLHGADVGQWVARVLCFIGACTII
jgi:hypothetical protein